MNNTLDVIYYVGKDVGFTQLGNHFVYGYERI